MALYLIKYRPPRETFIDDATPDESTIIEKHFVYLQKLMYEKKLKMAGRTDDAQFGIALLEVDNKMEALDIMENDPAIVNKIFTGVLFPFSLALWSK